MTLYDSTLDTQTVDRLLHPQQVADQVLVLTHPDTSEEYLADTLKALKSHLGFTHLYTDASSLPGALVALVAHSLQTKVSLVKPDEGPFIYQAPEDLDLSDDEEAPQVDTLNKALSTLAHRAEHIYDSLTHLTEVHPTLALIYIPSDQETGLIEASSDDEVAEAVPTDTIAIQLDEATIQRLSPLPQDQMIRLVLPAPFGAMISEHNRPIRLTYQIPSLRSLTGQE